MNEIKKKKKICFETQIAPAENGIIVKIGCKIFVGKPNDLKSLIEYYNGNVPDFAKKYVKEGESFINSQEVCTECPNEMVIQITSLPKFIKHKIRIGVFKVTNGYVIVNKKVYITTKKAEILKFID